MCRQHAGSGGSYRSLMHIDDISNVWILGHTTSLLQLVLCHVVSPLRSFRLVLLFLGLEDHVSPQPLRSAWAQKGEFGQVGALAKSNHGRVHLLFELRHPALVVHSILLGEDRVSAHGDGGDTVAAIEKRLADDVHHHLPNQPHNGRFLAILPHEEEQFLMRGQEWCNGRCARCAIHARTYLIKIMGR